MTTLSATPDVTPQATTRVPEGRTRAPLVRLLRSELRLIFRRPRTLIGLGLLALVPIAVGIGVAVAGSRISGGGDGGPPLQALVGNGIALPVISLGVSLTMLLPLVAGASASDAIAGEATHGTLRGLLLAPVGRLRLLAVKTFGVATMCLVACLLMSVVGVLAGLALLGSDGLITVSGTTVSFGDGLSRVLLAVLWVTVQLWAIAAIGLAVSAFTDHPLVVLALTLGMVIVFGVLTLISSLDWLHPYLLSESWPSLFDLLREPVPTDGLIEGVGRAACYIVIGLSVAGARMATKDG